MANASLLCRSAVKRFALEEAKKRTDVQLSRVSPEFVAKVEAATVAFVENYIATTPFTGKTIN